MLGSSVFERGLEASLLTPHIDPAARLLCVRKVIVAIERRELKGTHRICAALRKVIDSVGDGLGAEPEHLQLCAEFHKRVRAFDPRRAATQPEKLAESFASRVFGEPIDRTADGDDPWNSAAPLNLQESLRLIDVERSFHLRGADPRALILAALDGREFSMASLRTLHKHLTESFSAGGVCLSTGPLHSEVTRILQSQGSIAAVDPNAKTYGDNLWEEIERRMASGA